jgi:transglutaminase-like putative cysteine protease
MTAAAAAAPRPLAADPTLPIPTARGLAFFALAAFGSLHWMVLLEPSEPKRALYALVAGAVAMGGMRGAARLSHALSQAAAAGVVVVVLVLALLGGGIADELLRPDRWGELTAGISAGLQALPGVRVPYRGLDEWTRTVIPVGGTLLVAVAGALAFWPRRQKIGFPGAALFLLVALYAIPAVALNFENEFLRGAALALLVMAFLRLEKLRVGDAGNAGLVAVGVATLALIVAPALDSGQPWWDYERWADDAASARSTSFSWNHNYGPLDWPRDGRELLRVRADKRPAYWKAENLDGFDGIHWTEIDASVDDPGRPENEEALLAGTQRIRVTIRNLSSSDFITAGYADEVDSPTIRETPRGDGTWIAGRKLHRGDAYTATVYTPQTNEDERRAVGNESARPDLARYRRLLLPAGGSTIGQTGAPLYVFDFPAFGDGFATLEARILGDTHSVSAAYARRVLRQGPYRRTWALARQLKAESETQEDYVQAVLSYLRGEQFNYSETPPRSSYNLDGFLFDGKSGYCQQYSGAMALLLRMAGIPARVATGFTSGSLDSKTREYVVRDLDAHSWVEVWYRDIGWVTFDPTPAVAPARSQPSDGGPTRGGAGGLGPPSLGGDRPSDPGRRGLTATDGTPWTTYALLAVLGLLVAGAGAMLWRARRRRAGTPPATVMLDELERALRRTRRHPGAGITLRGLEERFARSPAAAGYVRAVRELRYGGRPSAPTSAQRRGLRAELARGGGPVQRLRAWWALPPRAL